MSLSVNDITVLFSRHVEPLSSLARVFNEAPSVIMYRTPFCVSLSGAVSISCIFSRMCAAFFESALNTMPPIVSVTSRMVSLFIRICNARSSIFDASENEFWFCP
jgi:hypothetical protein